MEINRSNDSSQVELVRSSLDRSIELVDIISSMIASNYNKRMGICQELSEEGSV
jgi:hypothetical protein